MFWQRSDDNRTAENKQIFRKGIGLHTHRSFAAVLNSKHRGVERFFLRRPIQRNVQNHICFCLAWRLFFKANRSYNYGTAELRKFIPLLLSPCLQVHIVNIIKANLISYLVWSNHDLILWKSTQFAISICLRVWNYHLLNLSAYVETIYFQRNF